MSRDFVVVQWLRICPAMQGSRVQFLVGELRSHMCLTLCRPMDYNLPCSSVHGIIQARILGWVAITFSRGSSQPRDGTQVSYIGGGFFIIRATWEAPCCNY